MRYAELFAGVGGFRLGIEQAMPEAVLIYANDNDRHACAVYRHHWGDITEGDIREQSTATIPDFDLLTAGFPCQTFSVAGKRAGFDDTRGTLFFEVARFLADKRPRHFLLENVKGLLSSQGGKDFQVILGVLSDLGYRVEWEVLNSTCWVPQNRERVFIVGHSRNECAGTVFPLREDDGVYTEASGQDSVAKRTMIAETAFTKSNRRDSRVKESDIVNNLDSGNSQAVMVVHTAFPGNVRFYGDKTPTISTPTGGGHLPYVSDNNPVVVERPHGYNQSIIKSGICLRGEGHSEQNQFILSRTRSEQNYKSTNATSVLRQSDKQENVVWNNNSFRRLTPVECERLQGWPPRHTAYGLYRSEDIPRSKRSEEEYTVMPVSDSQRYRMVGNGVTADCVREVVKKMIHEGCL